MKRFYYLLLSIIMIPTGLFAQQLIQENDSLNTMYVDSIFRELPEVMVVGERPIVKASYGKLIYDLPKIVSGLPVDNVYDAIKELPGVVDMNGVLTLAGQGITVVLNGKVSTVSAEQLKNLLKSIPVSRIEKAEVMYSAPARYQVRGPLINIILKSDIGNQPSLQGELYTAYNQQHYESLSERGSLLYSGLKFSADFLYSYSYDRGWMGTDKKALHTLADGSVHPMNLQDVSTSRNRQHNARLGMDYTFSKNHQLSLVYTTEFSGYNGHRTVAGAQESITDSEGDNQLHNVKVDYSTPFRLKGGAEFTFYHAPSNQLLNSKMGEEVLDFKSCDNQQINQWRFYLGQEHSLGKGWEMNYGAYYTTALDNSSQMYYDKKTGELLPGNNMKSRRHEQTLNVYTGIKKSFGEKLSADISLAVEQYHTDIWNEWNLYPVANISYVPADGHTLQLAVSSDKGYPSYWSVQNSTSYMGAYSEIQGNPLLKPELIYQTTLSYILKGKYVFSFFYNYTKDDTKQVLYQSPERLVEIYKYMNFDYSRQIGLTLIVPLKIKKWLNSRFTIVGLNYRQKDSDFWDTSFDRKLYTFVLSMNNTFTLPVKPDLKFILSGFYQNRMIQGIYDLPRSGNLNLALRYTFAKEKAQLTLRCNDIFNTSVISPQIHFEKQNVTNNYLQSNRTLGLSFSYKFGGYKEKKREEIDTSRFK